MSSSASNGDPRARNVRRPTRVKTFHHGKVDPVITKRRPFFTVGNAILFAIMILFGMYATGNLPQLDALFDSMNNHARAHNDVVVGAIVGYAVYIAAALGLAFVCLLIFLHHNQRRRQLSDPKGWHKVADAPVRRHKPRRPDEPSLVHPLGKKKPHAASPAASAKRKTAKHAAANFAAAKAAIATPEAARAATPEAAKPATPPPVLLGAADARADAAKAEAIKAAAAREQAAAASGDLPSMVMPLGKTRKPRHSRTSGKLAKPKAPVPGAPGF